MIAHAFAALGSVLILGSVASSQVTQRVTLGSAGVEGDDQSSGPSLSPDGRYLAFTSAATNLVNGDTNATLDVFLRDRSTGTTERVSVGPGDLQGNSWSHGGWVTPDGRFVVFSSSASNLVPGDTNGRTDAFIRDRAQGTTERLSVTSNGTQANDMVFAGPMSPDGRFVLLTGLARNLVPGDTNGSYDVFVHDRQNHTTERVSVDSSGSEANEGSYNSSISDEGRLVAFASEASNLVPLDLNGHTLDAFVHDRVAGTTELVSVASNGAQADGGWGGAVRVSGNGRCVAFEHSATNLVPGDTNGVSDVFVRDLHRGTTERVSVSSGGLQANGESSYPFISVDGRFVAFQSYATNLVPGDTNGSIDTFIRDRLLATTERVGLDMSGGQIRFGSGMAFMSADGRFVTFQSFSSFLPEDSNGVLDGFLRDRIGGPSFASLCDPGVGGVAGCPCANPPSGAGRGCDNSAGTGGAALSASGGTFLSSDSLVLEATREYPGTSSLLLQGSSPLSSGAPFGQGVRCLGGQVELLFAKVTVGGRMRAPDFEAGDPSISARSAARGDLIRPGERRWYVVAYRDPSVLGACAVTSTFNTTQTGLVLWSP